MVAALLLNLILLLLAATSDAFSIRPTAIATVSTVPPTKLHKIRCSCLPSSSRQAVTTLQASNNGIIPYYEELMERMPSKKVLEVVDRARGSPIVASGKVSSVM